MHLLQQLCYSRWARKLSIFSGRATSTLIKYCCLGTSRCKVVLFVVSVWSSKINLVLHTPRFTAWNLHRALAFTNSIQNFQSWILKIKYWNCPYLNPFLCQVPKNLAINEHFNRSNFCLNIGMRVFCVETRSVRKMHALPAIVKHCHSSYGKTTCIRNTRRPAW